MGEEEPREVADAVMTLADRGGYHCGHSREPPNWPNGVIDPWLIEFANDPNLGWPPLTRSEKVPRLQ
jgi:hypothetical protein